MENSADLLDYARQGVQHQGLYFAIPQLGCGSLLFYRKEDTQLANAETLSKISQTLGQCPFKGEVPTGKQGLLLDMSDDVGNICLYVESSQDIYGVYTNNPPKPNKKTLFNPWPVSNLQKLANSSNKGHVLSSDIDRAALFAKGKGRALVGYSEAMEAMALANEDFAKEIAFKFLPLADRNTVHLFYSDVVGINPLTQQRKLAVQLANLVASEQVMLAALKGNEHRSPQYLLPVRHSVFNKLAQQDELYGRLYAMVQTSEPSLFNFGANARAWTEAIKADISHSITDGIKCE